DYRALPETTGGRPEVSVPYVAPRNRIEEEMASIWRELLGIDKVGIHDNFFDLGGHSLLATQANSRFTARTGREISLSRFFENPVLSAIAESAVESQQPLDEIPRLSFPGPVEVSYAQQRLWFIDRVSGGTSAYNVAMAVSLEGEVREEYLEEALQAVVER